MKYIVNYMPENLSQEKMQYIRENFSPSMESEESNTYQCDVIMENTPNDREIAEACE